MIDLAKQFVDILPSVGEKSKQDLAGLGIYTIADLFAYYPYRYEDYNLSNLAEAEHEERVTIQGRIMTQPSVRWYGKNKSRMLVKIDVEGTIISAIWYNQTYLKSMFLIGKVIVVSGKWDSYRLQIVAERTVMSEEEQKRLLGRFEPIYSITSEVKMGWLRKLIYQAFASFGREIPEILPEELRQKYKLLSRPKAMFYLHFPKNKREYALARRTMAYEELFLYECKLMWRKKVQASKTTGIAHSFDTSQVDQLIKSLSFPLTKAQHRVVQEILTDLRQDRQMNRLVQGDVGSGKTVVAAIALYANFLSGYQGALMVPTEILADQHTESLQKLLAPLGVRVITLTGKMSTKERRDAYAEIEMGLADLVVGTHALIQESVVYKKLGLVITDEQHRFGVKQRAALRNKGEAPDVLFMTATPIPRTLAITVFGEMDVSTIDELPAGRQPVETYWVKKEMWPRIIRYIEKEANHHHQAYVICPLIEESEKLDLQNAQEVYEQLTMELAPIRVGLLHGRMNAAEKEAVMSAFASNEVQVLISTTVVEVGVNVPNATVIVIYDADRFGLAQLHQLRGRVGRGGGAATCILVANPKSEMSVERMRIMTETVDGFVIAQRDLELRGPGDFLGVKQSGLPDFKVADLNEDGRILEVARQDAIRLIYDGAFSGDPAYKQLLTWIRQEQLETTNLD